MDYGNTKTPSMQHGLGSTTATAGFSLEEQPEFPWVKSQWATVIKNLKKLNANVCLRRKKKQEYHACTEYVPVLMQCVVCRLLLQGCDLPGEASVGRWM